MNFAVNDSAVNFTLGNELNFYLKEERIEFTLNASQDLGARLLENGFYRLLEDGSIRLLE